MRTTTARDNASLSEMLEDFEEESAKSLQESLSCTPSGCACMSCPYKKELEKVDDFYNELLDTPGFLGL